MEIIFLSLLETSIFVPENTSYPKPVGYNFSN